MMDRFPRPGSIRRPENIVIAAMLVEARLAAGLSQLRVAEMLGVAQTFISKMEVLERKIEFAVVRDLCAVYGVEFGRFIAEFERRLKVGDDKPAPRLHRADKGTRRR